MRSTPILVVALLLGTACSDAPTDSDDGSNGSFATTTTAPLAKPTVSIPAQVPSELVVTDLKTGIGPKAEVGDSIIVYYVGVLSDTGEEFDANYGSRPIEFYIGAGRVILGWERGLVGAQKGTRRQLDIPSDLAYGESGNSPLTGKALTFVIDVVAVVPTSEKENEPQVTVTPADNIPVMQSTDLIVGEGETPQDGNTVAIQILTYRADTGELLASDWGGPPLSFEYSGQSQVFPGILAVVKGMKVGGRRQAQVPFILMFDGQGSEDFGLPAGVDVVVVIDLVAVY